MIREKTVQVQTEEPVTIPALDPAQPQQAPTYTVRHNGEEHTLTMDELLACAQKGLDYDRVRTQRDKLRAGDAEARYESFFEAHPEITQASQIPQEVIAEVAQGQDLAAAYLAYENRRLQERVEELEQAAKPVPEPILREGSTTGDDFLSGLFGR